MNGTEPDPNAQRPTFSVATMREMLNAHVFRDKGPLSSLRMPSSDALAALAKRLNYMRFTFSQLNGPWAEGDSLARRLEAAVQELEAVLPELHAEYSNAPYPKEDDPDPRTLLEVLAWQEIRKATDALAGLRAAVNDMRQYRILFTTNSESYEQFGRWRDCASHVAAALVEAMRSTNPGAALGRSNNGPVPRFVAAVVPLITGEKPEVGNVAQTLKVQARTTGDKSKD